MGLTIAENMLVHGARHLVFLSRSGASTPTQRQALANFREQGCQADALRCDVTDHAQVASFVAESGQKGWKIKGLVQCAMVLRVSRLYFHSITTTSPALPFPHTISSQHKSSTTNPPSPPPPHPRLLHPPLQHVRYNRQPGASQLRRRQHLRRRHRAPPPLPRPRRNNAEHRSRH